MNPESERARTDSPSRGAGFSDGNSSMKARPWRIPLARNTSAIATLLLAASIVGMHSREAGVISGRWLVSIGGGVIKVGRSAWRDSSDHSDPAIGNLTWHALGSSRLAAFWDSSGASQWEDFAGAWRPFHRTTPNGFSVVRSGGPPPPPGPVNPFQGADMLIIPTWQPLLLVACIACYTHGLIRGRRGIRFLR